MQCCTTPECNVHSDPAIDQSAVGAPPGLNLRTITPFPSNAAPTAAPTMAAPISPPVVLTEYYYTYITW
jgi:hypothetical protein